ncbi:EF-hand calcium-binding domain-containing protein 11 isoform X1 [Crotalus tigris]|uniref:EF-hand calcium-binding domain-containing protein 11 isoform X1 n=1 Tax=Crotalus tigris TaxID=88082 RepID=UPI00192F6A00|nr:EF-hand calcium-binding domain-containing protein 11 isoform X1 [Crotalus tigris]
MWAAPKEAAKSKDCPAEKYRNKRWVKAFEACDENNKGYLSREDYKVAIVMLFGYKPSKMEADSAMASTKQNPFGLSLEDFLNLMTTKKVAHFYHSEIRRIFMSFDRQCKGFLSFEDFKKAFSIVAPKLSERIIVEAFSQQTQSRGMLAGSWKSWSCDIARKNCSELFNNRNWN